MFALEIRAPEGYSGACNDSSHILDCQRVSAIFAGKILSLFFSQFSQKYFSQNFASILHFSRKNAKFRGKVCEMRTKIFAFFSRNFSFVGNPTCIRVYIFKLSNGLKPGLGLGPCFLLTFYQQLI